MKTMSAAEWRAEGERRFGADPRKWVFVCPSCGTHQSAEDFYTKARMQRGTGALNGYLGFSCIGRWTGAGPHDPNKPAGRGCDWTLGGLFRIHTLEVIDEEGGRHPRFEFADVVEAEPKEAA